MKTKPQYFLIVLVVMTSFCSCKKTPEISSFKIENGVIGVKYININQIAVDPSNDNQFSYKKSKVRQYYSTFSALNKDQSKLYVQFRDSINRYFLQEIDTKTGNLTGVFSLDIPFSNMVFDDVNNRVLGMSSINSNSLSLYAFDVAKRTLTFKGTYLGSLLYLFAGKSFMRHGELYINSINDLYVIDFKSMDLKKLNTIGNCLDLEYDPVNDVAYTLINNSVGVELDKFDFNKNTVTKLMDIDSSTSFVQASMCYKPKTNEIVFFLNGNKRVMLDLNKLKYRIDKVKTSLTGCQSLHYNIEVSMKDIEQ